MTEDEKWMKIAINEAKIANDKEEIPVGALIIKGHKIIAKSHNQSILKHDATAHAEIQAIRKAGEFMQNHRLIDTTLYVTLEPCSMCLGAIIHARIKRVVFGAYETKIGVNSTCIDCQKKLINDNQIIIKGGILESDCKNLLQSFFKLRR